MPPLPAHSAGPPSPPSGGYCDWGRALGGEEVEEWVVLGDRARGGLHFLSLPLLPLRSTGDTERLDLPDDDARCGGEDLTIAPLRGPWGCGLVPILLLLVVRALAL
eukprot:CAMPEP_0114114012 /NCGR_PEP_ID=MMETSP0043_2-20121206/3212_1 /TAXON_ID=464988 /ORGANISM="Hemiselmis andersenii, Strain CCMP644" /LENGTH=105 /DNA_ID=CAMNT_0001206187 /DNA_START=227 /DNA_END=541 /DNA_ORIENTATION=+